MSRKDIELQVSGPIYTDAETGRSGPIFGFGTKSGYQRTDRTPLLLFAEPPPTLQTVDVQVEEDPKYSGHYAAYNVPYHFQQLVISIYNLRNALNNKKYWLYFFRIQKALLNYHHLLEKNSFKDGDELLVANNSTVIQTQLEVIAALKKSITGTTDLVRSVSLIRVNLRDLKEKFVYAMNGYKSKSEFPPPRTTAAQILLIKNIISMINDIGMLNDEEAWHKIFAHTFYHKNTTSIIALSFFALSIGTGMQSIFDYVLMDINSGDHSSASTAKHTFVHLGLPIIFFGIGLSIAIYALIAAKNKRQEMRQEQESEAFPEAQDMKRPPDYGTRKRTDLHAHLSTEATESVATLVFDEEPPPITDFFVSVQSIGHSIQSRADLAHRFMTQQLEKWAYDERNSQQQEAIAIMRTYLLQGSKTELSESIKRLMDENSIPTTPGYSSYYGYQ